MTAKLRPSIVNALQVIRQAKPAKEQAAAIQACLQLIGSKPEPWLAAGPLLCHLGGALLDQGEVAAARDALEKALRCARVDSRMVFPHLAAACAAKNDAAAARECMVEHLLAGGNREALAALPEQIREPSPDPPARWESWEEFKTAAVVKLSLINKLEPHEQDLQDAEWGLGFEKRAIHAVAERCDGYSLRRLVRAGSDPNARWRDRTPLHFLCAGDRLDLIDFLMAQGASVTGDFAPLLMHARSPRAIRVLTSAGADLEARDEKGRTPLIAAVDTARVDVAETLLELGADKGARDHDGRTALSIASGSSMRGRYEKLLPKLGPA